MNITADGGVTKQILQEGAGDSPLKGMEIQMLYQGCLADGSEFDSNQKRESPFKFTLGVGQVIQGWDVGVVTMKRGEKAVLTISPEYGYGDKAMGDKLPANSTLVFTVELLDFEEKPKEKWDYSAEERMQMSKKWKEEGNVAFKAGDFPKALKSYKLVTEYLEMDMKDSEEAKTMRVLCLGNCSLVYFKSKDNKQAVEYADMVLQNDAQNVKALFRKGQAYAAMGEYSQAQQSLEQALVADPANSGV